MRICTIITFSIVCQVLIVSVVFDFGNAFIRSFKNLPPPDFCMCQYTGPIAIPLIILCGICHILCLIGENK